MQRPVLIVLLTSIVAIGAAGCGNDKQEAPDVATPGPAIGTVPASFPKAGIAFRAPAGWVSSPGDAPLVTALSTGQATIAIYRYPRSEKLPRTKAELDAALDALVTAAKARDKTFTELKRARLEVDGAPAVQLRGTETIAGRPRTVRSTHIYSRGAEIVVDAFAPDADFRRVDAQSFRGVLRTMRLTEPVPGAK